MTVQDLGLVTFDEAQKLSGLPRRTFYRRLSDGSIRVFADGRDRRRRLVPVADLEKLTEPLVIRERKGAASLAS